MCYLCRLNFYVLLKYKNPEKSRKMGIKINVLRKPVENVPYLNFS